MAFNGTEGAPIELELAKQWTANYRATKSEKDVKAIFVGKDIIMQLLTGLITSEPVMELIKEDKLGLGKLVEKVKSFIGKKNPAEPEEPVA